MPSSSGLSRSCSTLSASSGNPFLPGWFQLTCYRDKRGTLLSYGATHQVATAYARQVSGQLADRQLFREHDPRELAPVGCYYWEQPPTTTGMFPYTARLQAARVTNHISDEDDDSDEHDSSTDDEAHDEPGPGATAKRMRCNGGSADATAASDGMVHAGPATAHILREPASTRAHRNAMGKEYPSEVTGDGPTESDVPAPDDGAAGAGDADDTDDGLTSGLALEYGRARRHCGSRSVGSRSRWLRCVSRGRDG